MEEQGSVGALLKGAVRMCRQLAFQSASVAEAQPRYHCREKRMAVRLEQSGVFERLTEAARPFMQPKAMGRPPYDLRVMMRVYILMRALGLSTHECICKLHCMPMLRKHCLIASEAEIPDQSTLHNFQARFETDDASRRMLEASVLALSSGGAVPDGIVLLDSTLHAAAGSTKNAARRRDEEMSSARKNGNWHFGGKSHIATAGSGLVIAMEGTTAKSHDINAGRVIAAGVLRDWKVRAVYGDAAYDDGTLRGMCAAHGAVCHAPRRKPPRGALTEAQRAENRAMSRVRCRVEHAFGVLKNVMGHRKMRVRGVARNASRFRILFAIGNFYRFGAAAPAAA